MVSEDSRPFRFGVVLTGAGSVAWGERCRRAEALGYDVVLVPDHLQRTAPFGALGVAAAVTEHVRIGTFVLDAAFYDPTVLAREVATLDALSGGRLELGLGAGYVRSEFEAIGVPFGTAKDRLDRLDRCLDRLRDLLGDPAFQPRPVQQPIPVLLGGNGNRMLRTAARHAHVVGFSGTSTDSNGRLSLIGASSFDDRVQYARAAAGERTQEIEWNVLLQVVNITDDREAGIAQSRRTWAPHLTVEEFGAAPTVLVGSVTEMAAELENRRRRLGLSYVAVLEPAADDFARVIEHLQSSSDVP